LVVSIFMNTFRFSYRGLPPHKFTPMPGVHNQIEATGIKLGGFSIAACPCASFNSFCDEINEK
jgi:hypothetical protein